MTATLVATLDGRLFDGDLPLVAADDLGLLRGDGVFETTLVVDSSPRDLDEHLARFEVSAAMLDLALPPADEWRIGVETVLDAWTGGREMVLRMVCTRGRESGGEVTAFVLGGPPSDHLAAERRDGVSAIQLPRGFAGDELAAMPWLLPGAKTLSYAVNMAARRYAQAHGADDVIFVGTDGSVLEGPTATVVIARGRTLMTPPSAGILAGVTMRRLFNDAYRHGWTTETASLRPDDLLASDGVWLVSGVRLLAPVVRIDGLDVDKGAAHDELASILHVP